MFADSKDRLSRGPEYQVMPKVDILFLFNPTNYYTKDFRHILTYFI